MEIKLEIKSITFIRDMYSNMLGAEIEPVKPLFARKLMISADNFKRLLKNDKPFSGAVHEEKPIFPTLADKYSAIIQIDHMDFDVESDKHDR